MRQLRKLVVSLIVFSVVGHARADINVGVILSLTGPAASIGIPAKNTVALWPTEIAGQKVKVTVLDDASDATAAGLAARRLIAEEKVDVLVGPSVTPTSLAVLQIAGESKIPMLSLAGGASVIKPQEGARRWAFKMPPSEEIMLKIIFDRMRKDKQKRLALVGMDNAYGQTFVDVAQKMAPAAGIEISGVERFGATDTSFVSQALKIASAKPDAILIAAAGTPAAMPQIELKNRGFKGTVFQTQAVANNDFLRVGGSSVNGTLMPVSPLLVAEQLPDSNPIKPVALSYVQKYEAKYGPNSRTLFGGIAWDAFMLIENAAPVALKTAQPGTPQFRQALRDAIEHIKNLTLSQGIYSLSPTDHNGADTRSQVLVTIENGKWRYVGQ